MHATARSIVAAARTHPARISAPSAAICPFTLVTAADRRVVVDATASVQGEMAVQASRSAERSLGRARPGAGSLPGGG